MSLKVEVSWNKERIIIEKDGETDIESVLLAVRKAMYRLKLRGNNSEEHDKHL